MGHRALEVFGLVRKKVVFSCQLEKEAHTIGIMPRTVERNVCITSLIGSFILGYTLCQVLKRRFYERTPQKD